MIFSFEGCREVLSLQLQYFWKVDKDNLEEEVFVRIVEIDFLWRTRKTNVLGVVFEYHVHRIVSQRRRHVKHQHLFNVFILR